MCSVSCDQPQEMALGYKSSRRGGRHQAISEMTPLHHFLSNARFALEPGDGATSIWYDRVVRSCKWDAIMMDEAANVMPFWFSQFVLPTTF